MSELNSTKNGAKEANQGALKFILFSLLGVAIFFVPISRADGSSKIPLVIIIDLIKKAFSSSINYIVLGLVVLLCITWIASKITNNKALKEYHKKDTYIIGTLYILAAIFTYMLAFKLGPAWFLHEDVGGLALYLGGSVLLTVTVAGALVVFLTEFGFLEFIGTLMEPLMRPLYRLPGRAAVDAVASFVAAPAVGVFITNKIYTEGNYTQREAAAIATNFSMCSLGFYALLASIGGITEYLPQIIIASFIVTFIMAAIVIRIPPISRKKDIYFNGREQTKEERTPIPFDSTIFARAFNEASKKASSVDAKCVYSYLWEAFTFAQKIVAYVVSISVIALVIATYTPFFNWLGVPIAPILSLFGLPNAEQIAPAVLITISEIALPVIIISGKNIAAMSIFFIVVLSANQLIFFTESANAMLEADIPLGFWDLIAVFLIRTFVAIPIVAFVTHMIF